MSRSRPNEGAYAARNAAELPVSYWRSPKAISNMLPRIISLSILFAVLLVAGLPPVACATPLPAQNCCPDGPQLNCDLSAPMASKSDRVHACCVEGFAVSAKIPALASSVFIRKLPKQSGSAPISGFNLISDASPLDSNYPATIRFPPSIRHSHCALYLSTGRLRL